jgi:signal transduction histidine kinase
VDEEELPLLKEKFRRGSNAGNREGAGLGLYISDYFMREMGGELLVENGEEGLRVTVVIRQSGI